jgi:uncharacterized damage-inducible protein DinB
MAVNLSAMMRAELEQEATTTRRVLERVPEDRLAWRPHPKSMSLGQLAYHVAGIPGAIADLVSVPVREVPNVPLTEATSVEEMLTLLESSVAQAAERLDGWTEEDLFAEWRMIQDGQTLLALPRIAMLRSVMLNHWYHHRGQLLIYLRLLDVSVPAVYGPTADENPFVEG